MESCRNSAKKKSMMEECMVFVVSSAGFTKMVRKRKSESVRLVSSDGLAARQPASITTNVSATRNKCSSSLLTEHPKNNHSWLCHKRSHPTSCQDISDDDRVPPSMISFAPQMNYEYLLISGVSNRAKGTSRRRMMEPGVLCKTRTST